MFERRLKIFLTLIVILTAVVALRSAQIQLMEHDDWHAEAAAIGQHSQFVEATRGRIIDIHGRELALDAPCSDVCVRYSAIVGTFATADDRTWLRNTALSRLQRRMGEDFDKRNRAARRALLEQEIQKVRADIDSMWMTLARLSGKSLEEIEEQRQAIVQRVEMRRRYLWHLNFEKASRKKEEADEDSSWLKRWLTETGPAATQIDKFDMVISEQREAHPILADVDAGIADYLAKNAEQFPGLLIRRSTVRYYPHGDVAAHVIGHLSRVTREDLKANAGMTGPGSELRRYWVNDTIGRTGIEALAESALRGTRGRIGPVSRDDSKREIIPAASGRDVRTTLDVELQQNIQQLFRNVKLSQKNTQGQEYSATAEMNGAVVVIDVETGEVRALVSYPSFDLNRFQEEFAALNADELRRPFMNRATQMALEPGSTVKPMVGIAAVTERLAGVNDTVECGGWLVIRGRKYMNLGRCWTARHAIAQGMNEIHHYGIADGRIALSDALKFSCNVYFETMADRLGLERLAHYYDLFGLGRPTGIGIGERSGRVPDAASVPRNVRSSITWFSGIGQTQVLATPVQMANVAASIARDGVWMRPRLVTGVDLPHKLTGPDMVDLRLSPGALAAARDGMRRVVNEPHGTAFTSAHNDAVVVAGKTGTAQAPPFSYPRRDEQGELMFDADGKPLRETLAPSTFERQNPQAPWYWAWGADFSDLSHAWFVGFAPANRPKLAFAVMVEYGGGGGSTAGRLASDVIEACARHGYLPSKSNANVVIGRN